MSSPSTLLSEQTCADLILKAIQLNLLPGLLTTLDGKEFVTPARLDSEIEEAVSTKGGRVNVMDLQGVLNVDFRYIEARAKSLLERKRGAWVLLGGEIINSTFFDEMDTEINTILSDVGWVSIGTLCQNFHFSLHFLLQVRHRRCTRPQKFLTRLHIEDRLEKSIHGRTDMSFPGIVFTDRYAIQLKTTIAKLIDDIDSPTPVSTILTQNNLPEPLFYPLLESLIKQGGFNGSFRGRREKAVYTPDSFKAAQAESVKAFVSQNGYIEYYSVAKLNTEELPRDFLRREFPGIMLLETCAATQSVVATVEASVEEMVQNDSWLDVTHLVPPCFTDADTASLLQSLAALKPHSQKSPSAATVEHAPLILGSYVTTTGFVQRCAEAMHAYMQKKASGVLVMDSKDDEAGEEDTATAGKRGKGGTKAGTKDGRKKNNAKGKNGVGEGESEDGISQREISLQIGLAFHDLDADLCDLIATRLAKQLAEQYVLLARSVYLPALPAEEPGEAKRKRRISELADRVNEAWFQARLCARGVGVFEDENVRASLEKHVLRTMCLELIDLVIVQQAFVYRLQQWLSFVGTNPETPLMVGILTDEQLHKIVERLPEEVKIGLTNVRKSAGNGKIIADFLSSFETHVGLLSHLPLKKLDKKIERQTLHRIRVSLLTQLRAAPASNSALVLHLVSLILFQTCFGVPLHASGKFVPKIVRQLEPALARAGHQNQAARLAALQIAVVESVKGGGVPVEVAAVEQVRMIGLEAEVTPRGGKDA
ncbi:hypothetical protein BC938DRAFT_471911 [Jimgerdemannia flammicorona]|uniref:Uncharacterized protein n=1 Tax=Jimgerdemannia flammicorona TaxID=994334 RepID=A0A433Q751_9FUNG|nr:hypothetical protein BC938DRAFT_471911 [Jimgerdemannia flammicorona]